MNLGLLEGWAAGGAADLTPGATVAEMPAGDAGTAPLDPVFCKLMDLFGTPVADESVRERETRPETSDEDNDESAADLQLLAGLSSFVLHQPVELSIPDATGDCTDLQTVIPVTPRVVPHEIPADRPHARKPRDTAKLTDDGAPISEGLQSAALEGVAPEALAKAPADTNSTDITDDQATPERKQLAEAATKFTAVNNTPQLESSAPKSSTGAPTAEVPAQRQSAKAPAPSVIVTAPTVHARHTIGTVPVRAALPAQAPVQESLPQTTAAQIVQSIQLAWSRDGGEARIKLDPQQFGDLSVAMRVERGQVVARVQAEAPVVREWLHSNQDTLRAGLAEHQLRLDRLEIAATDDRRDSAHKDEHGQRDDEARPHGRRRARRPAHQTFEVNA